MELDPGNKLREEPGVDKVGFHITVVKHKNENSKGDLKARVGGGLFIYLNLILRSIPEYAYGYRSLQSSMERERERKNSGPLQSPTALLPKACVFYLKWWSLEPMGWPNA